MKKLAICVIAVAGLIGTPVLAADIATKGLPPQPLPPPPVFSWTGLYIGLNAGGAFDNKVTEEPTGLLATTGNSTTSLLASKATSTMLVSATSISR